MKGKKIEMKLVLVEWIDSSFPELGWHYPEAYDYLLPVMAKSVGFILKDTKTELVLVSNVCKSPTEADCDSVSGGIAIPKRSVVKVKELKA